MEVRLESGHDLRPTVLVVCDYLNRIISIHETLKGAQDRMEHLTNRFPGDNFMIQYRTLEK